MPRDYYAEARDLARQLEDEGATTDAEALRDAIAAGSTATEISMALRWHLARIDRENPPESADTRKRIQELASAIDAALAV